MNDSSKTIKQGDKVTHFRDPERVGTVVKTRPDQHTNETVYVVAWTKDGPGITYRSGLAKVTDGGE